MSCLRYLMFRDATFGYVNTNQVIVGQNQVSNQLIIHCNWFWDYHVHRNQIERRFLCYDLIHDEGTTK